MTTGKFPTVSVIIPAYNAQSSLMQCLESVLKQTFKDIEIIVVNDGSTDHTEKIALSYQNKIKYIAQENKGQGAARNRGLSEAKGEYISFLDADDYWDKKFIEECVFFLKNHPNASAVLTAWRKIFDENTEEIVPPITNDRIIPMEGIVINSFFKFWAEQNNIQTGAIMIHKSLVEKCGGMRETLRISQDLEYWALLGINGKWGFLPKPLLINTSRIHARKVGSINKYRIRRGLCTTVEEWEKRIKKHIPDKERAFFNVVLGRVASGYAHAKILAMNFEEGRYIVRKYGKIMPTNKLTRLMKIFSNRRLFFWRLCCIVLLTKEYSKDFSWKIFKT